jgi:hypothetical protein
MSISFPTAILGKYTPFYIYISAITQMGAFRLIQSHILEIYVYGFLVFLESGVASKLVNSAKGNFYQGGSHIILSLNRMPRRPGVFWIYGGSFEWIELYIIKTWKDASKIMKYANDTNALHRGVHPDSQRERPL